MFKTLLKLGFALGLAVMMAEVERLPTKYNAKGAEPVVIEGLLAADTQLIPNKNGNVILRIIAPAEEIEVTAVTPNEVGGNPIADLTNKIASGKVEIMGPFDPSVYNDAKGNLNIKVNKAGVKIEIIEVAY
jgi:hypothetical protein